MYRSTSMLETEETKGDVNWEKKYDPTQLVFYDPDQHLELARALLDAPIQSISLNECARQITCPDVCVEPAVVPDDL